MPPKKSLVENLTKRIEKLAQSVRNFEYARQRLAMPQTAEGLPSFRLEQALITNQNTLDSLNRELASALEQLSKEQTRS